MRYQNKMTIKCKEKAHLKLHLKVLPLLLSILITSCATPPREESNTTDQSKNLAFEYIVPNTKWRLEVRKGTYNSEQNTTDEIKLIDLSTQKTLLKFSPSSGAYFDRANVAVLKGYPHPLLLTEWTEGARTVSLRIFDPSKGDKSLLHEVQSLSYMKILEEKDHLKIKIWITNPKNETSEIETTQTWRPK